MIYSTNVNICSLNNLLLLYILIKYYLQVKLKALITFMKNSLVLQHILNSVDLMMLVMLPLNVCITFYLNWTVRCSASYDFLAGFRCLSSIFAIFEAPYDVFLYHPAVFSALPPYKKFNLLDASVGTERILEVWKQKQKRDGVSRSQ